jgi:hypothetical protein
MNEFAIPEFLYPVGHYGRHDMCVDVDFHFCFTPGSKDAKAQFLFIKFDAFFLASYLLSALA